MYAHVRDSKKVNKEHEVRVSFTKFVRNIPVDFLQTRQEKINHYIQRIDNGISTQEHLDRTYWDFVTFIKDEMKNKLNHRTVDAVIGNNNKKRKVKKPLWADHLTELWNRTCKAENQMLSSKNITKQRLRAVYVCERKQFDRECQKAKREHQSENKFWISISPLGFHQFLLPFFHVNGASLL